MSEESDVVENSKIDNQLNEKKQVNSVDIQTSDYKESTNTSNSNESELQDEPTPKHPDSETNGTFNSNEDSKKKRSRRSYNCGPCKKHKIKCDMTTPCGNCIKYNRVQECHAKPPNPPTYQQFLIQQQRRRKYLEKKDKKHGSSDCKSTGLNQIDRYKTLEDNQIPSMVSQNATPVNQQTHIMPYHTYPQQQQQQPRFYPSTPHQMVQPQVMYPIQQQQVQQPLQQQQQQHPQTVHAPHSHPFITSRPVLVSQYQSMDPYILYQPNLPNGVPTMNYSNHGMYPHPQLSQPQSQLQPQQPQQQQPPPHHYAIHQHPMHIGMPMQPSNYHFSPVIAHPVSPNQMPPSYIPHGGGLPPPLPPPPGARIPSIPQLSPHISDSRKPSQPQMYLYEPSILPPVMATVPAHARTVETENEKPVSPMKNSKTETALATSTAPEPKPVLKIGKT